MSLTQQEQEVLDKSMAKLKLTGRAKVPKDIFYKAAGIDFDKIDDGIRDIRSRELFVHPDTWNLRIR